MRKGSRETGKSEDPKQQLVHALDLGLCWQRGELDEGTESTVLVPQLLRLTLLDLRLPRVYMQLWGRGDGEHQGCVRDLPARPQSPGSELLKEGGGPWPGKLLGLFISYKGLLGFHPCDLVLGWESGGGAGRKGPGWPVEVGSSPLLSLGASAGTS